MLTPYFVPKLSYRDPVRTYKPLPHCAELFKNHDIETFCLLMADEHVLTS